jgi:hypothetical protein
MDLNRSFFALVASGSLGLLLSATAATEPLLLTQSPRSPAGKPSQTSLERLYPAGSRVVVVNLAAPREVKVLSEGLDAAGDPVLSYDGQVVLFVGRPGPESDWQVYQARMNGGRCRAITSMPGGAMDPAFLPDGSAVFASPTPRDLSSQAPQLYAQPTSGRPQQLTFSPAGAFDPTVLPEGRILFVSASPHDASAKVAGLSLFTVNNDGTEFAAFACQHDPPARISRPRPVTGGRIAFLAGPLGGESADTSAECVRTARPFLSRAKLFSNEVPAVRSVQPGGESNLFVCAKSPSGTWAVYCVSGQEGIPGTPLFEDPRWDCVEALPLRSRPRPMGRLTNMDPTKKTGRILCLNINDTTYSGGAQPGVAIATRVRVLTRLASGTCRPLGELPVQADGSFMAEVPADSPLGFEALDENGSVVRRVAPMIWVRAGENRSCVGCHASHNRVPHNHRPEAVRSPIPLLSIGPEAKFTQKAP